VQPCVKGHTDDPDERPARFGDPDRLITGFNQAVFFTAFQSGDSFLKYLILPREPRPFRTVARHQRVDLAADDPVLREPQAARALAAALMADPKAGGSMPPNQRALALALAGSGDFDGAADLLRPLREAAWMLPPAEVELLDTELAAYADGSLPEAWPEGDPLLAPPPFNAAQLMRDYPATKPY
jgi:hypothetical protein